MKAATDRKRKALSSFEGLYASLFHEYAKDGSETALGKAYELGRKALAERKSLLELASIHHLALQKLMEGEADENRRAILLRLSSDFLAECLSPYEMAHQGFQDAVTALRQVNKTLENEIKRIAFAVHDEAGQLLVAVHLALADLSRELAKPQQERVGQVEGLLNQVETT